MPGLHTEVQQAKTDNIHNFLKNTIKQETGIKGDIVIMIVIVTRYVATKDSDGAG